MNDGSRAFNPPSASQTLINRAGQIICSRLSNEFSACLCLQRASLCPGFALLSRKISLLPSATLSLHGIWGLVRRVGPSSCTGEQGKGKDDVLLPSFVGSI